jgi:membrane protein YdbS with pleckstrin-like domain
VQTTHRQRDEKNDVTVYRTHLHPMSLAGGATGAAVTLLIAGLIVWNNTLPGAGAAEAALWGTGVALLWVVGPLLRFLRSEVVVGERDLEVTAGVLASRRRASLAEIAGVVEHAGALGRRLGYGTVVIHGRGSTGATLRHVRDAAALCRVLTARAKAAASR